ncbi:hypothetical protein ACIRQY_33570 [Streptomyces sp. NPDC101490]|uniref:hypothetical protein n=1 Tax=Streptomyces sp. NPDC101490 TaxID=3366143 RepID=UPI00382CB898
MARQGNTNHDQATAWALVPYVGHTKSEAFARLTAAQLQVRQTPPPRGEPAPALTQAQRAAALNAARKARKAKATLVFKANGRERALTVDADGSLGAAAYRRILELKRAELERITDDARLDASLAHFEKPMPRDVARALSRFIRSNPPAPPLRPRRR